jgi:hypothetical protein
MLFAIAAAAALAALPAGASARTHHVLRVGTFHGVRGQYTTIQAAVNAARPGDWVLVAPGDYKERADYSGAYKATDEPMAGVWIGRTKRGLHLRGMDRNGVMVDGTKPGAPKCSSNPADQDAGPLGADGKPLGRNGVEAFKVDGVTIENLSACNFLASGGEGGNEIWFNGGDGTGRIGMGRYLGRYLNGTSTYFEPAPGPGAKYGIFASNVRGPGLIDRTYASNMRDGAYYIGACPDCRTVVKRAHAQYSALGYTGTNSGGRLVIEDSEWDHNKTGIVTNSQNNDDAPAPQSGRCPHTRRYCTFFRNNDIHDNNNPNVPTTGVAGFGPVGTGLVVAGGRFDTVSRNRIHDNGAWGVLVVPYPDNDEPPPIAHCQGGTPGGNGFRCYFDDWGNRILSNRFRHNGFFGNPTNGDIGDISGRHNPANCWNGNTDPGGVTATPSGHSKCGVAGAGAPITSPLALQVICDSELIGPCTPAPGMSYPRVTQVVMPPLKRQKTMPNPCSGVPANPWCRGRRR